MGVMNDGEVLRVQKAVVSRDTAIIKAVIAMIELEQAQLPVLDVDSQVLSFRGKRVWLNENEYRFVRYLACERLGEYVPFLEIDQALGVSRAHGYATSKYCRSIASRLRPKLRHLGFNPLQTDQGKYHWNPDGRMTLKGRNSAA